ncbi:hypothetical protein K0M31_002079 [Melipona bicolor]|uniref:Uncharacterized protein n=1 Tax=Melipona bicolor TaxID=60889 RepID=A0AA40GHW1_9HYME|nr:hypothetical protein K0M31_002079 [Melipona bicolor]
METSPRFWTTDRQIANNLIHVSALAAVAVSITRHEDRCVIEMLSRQRRIGNIIDFERNGTKRNKGERGSLASLASGCE